MRIWPMKRRGNQDPEFLAWQNMNKICSPGARDRKYYYERGIEVHPDWRSHGYDKERNRQSYQRFLVFMGRKPENTVLGRVDKSKSFVPFNVAWMDKTQVHQGRSPNQRYSYSTDEQLIAEIRRRGYAVRRSH